MFDRPTVLLVDDDLEIVQGARLRLMAAGYHTLTAHNGQAAVSSAASSQPNVVVMDVRMPVQDGLAALVELKQSQDTKNIPVIMLSASIGDQQAALDAGAKYFLRKPYRGDALVQAVNSVIGADRPGNSSHRVDGPPRQTAESPHARCDKIGPDAYLTTVGPGRSVSQDR